MTKNDEIVQVNYSKIINKHCQVSIENYKIISENVNTFMKVLCVNIFNVDLCDCNEQYERVQQSFDKLTCLEALKLTQIAYSEKIQRNLALGILI